MNPEYVRISPQERIYGDKSLLLSQLSLINMIKRYKEYKAVRKEELLLKIELKKKFEETKVLLETLDRILPRVKMEDEKHEEKIKKEIIAHIEPEKTEAPKPHKSSVDEELKEIKRKLAML
jgi:hypothetical protein